MRTTFATTRTSGLFGGQLDDARTHLTGRSSIYCTSLRRGPTFAPTVRTGRQRYVNFLIHLGLGRRGKNQHVPQGRPGFLGLIDRF